MAKPSNGYRLTLDERDLQDGLPTADIAALSEEDEGEGLDDEEDEELDNLTLVAAVEQMICCCEAELASQDRSLPGTAVDDADGTNAPQDSGYGLFVIKARENLAKLTANEIDITEFSAIMSREMSWMERLIKRASRPPETPVIIDGVKMDL
jgi:hypothetical protein